MYTLRHVTLKDAEVLLKWKNDADTRRFSIESREPIAYGNHINWLAGRLSYPGYFMIESGGERVGTIRFDHGDVIEVALLIAPKWRGKGVASSVLGVACSLVQMQYNKPLMAKIVDGNTASYAVFFKAGFRPKNRHDGVTILYRGA